MAFDFIKRLLAPKPKANMSPYVNSSPYTPSVTATAPKTPVSPISFTNGGAKAPTPTLSPGGYSTLTAKGGSVPSPFSAPVNPQVKSPLAGYSMVPTRTDPTKMKLQAPSPVRVTSSTPTPSMPSATNVGMPKPVSPVIPQSNAPVAGQTPEEMAVSGANGTPTNQNLGGGTPPPPPTDPQMATNYDGALSMAEKAYQDSLRISPEELSTQEDLDRLTEATKNSYAKVSDQPIMLDFITGQLASVERRALNLAEPLERKMSRLQAARQSSMEASKFALERVDKKVEAQRKSATEGGFSLGQGESRYDASGKLIATGAPKPADHSPIYKEWQDAVGAGYKRDFNTYQNEDANRKAKAAGLGTTGNATAQAIMANPALWNSLTPSAKTALIPVLSSMGFQPPANLSSGQQDDMATMDTVKNDIDTLLAFGKNLPGVGAGGFGSGATWLAKVGIGSQEGQHIRNLIGNIQGTIAKLRGGTSFTPNEQKLLETYTPTINDADWQIEQKLIDLSRAIANKKTNLLGAINTPNPGGNLGTGGGAPPQQMQLPNGTIVNLQADGTYN